MTDRDKNKHLISLRGAKYERRGNSENKNQAKLNAGVVVFPGTNCDKDTFEACIEFGWEAEYVWHDYIFEQSSMHASHLRGEADLQYEQRTASVRKSGEGEKQSLKYPHPEFQELVPRSEIHPSPLKWEGQNADYINKSHNYLNNFDVIFLPGGFSYGDYLRSGALAKFSPIIEAVKDYIDNKRGFVFGICNGFQILCECGLLPGALTHNEGLKFVCKDVELILNEGKMEEEKGKRAENYQLACHCEGGQSPTAAIQRINEKTDDWIASLHFSNAPRNDMNCENHFNLSTHQCSKVGILAHQKKTITLPIAHAEGRYVADEKTLQQLKEKDMIFLTYVDNPNGSTEDIAGLYDKERRIIGMMPHPERAFFKELGNTDGKIIFEFIEQRCECRTLLY